MTKILSHPQNVGVVSIYQPSTSMCAFKNTDICLQNKDTIFGSIKFCSWWLQKRCNEKATKSLKIFIFHVSLIKQGLEYCDQKNSFHFRLVIKLVSPYFFKNYFDCNKEKTILFSAIFLHQTQDYSIFTR